MLTLNDGRTELWQWDTGRTLSVDADCSQVHFSNKVFGRSIDVDVTDGVAIIPDILLQTDKDLNVWAFVGTAENGYTKISKTFKVNRRNKPADYVFTPTDQMTLHTIQRQIGDLADLTTEEKTNLVVAINEVARTGGVDVSGAQVGQAIVVKAVDENGKPTEWAAADIPSGAQPDWNQNDDTQPGYIKNRPFYTGAPVETVVVEERTVTFVDHGGLYMANFPSTFMPTVGETYKVYWDGTAYECICVDVRGTPGLGNLSIAGAGPDTGEPFAASYDGTGFNVGTTDTSASHAISISGLVREIVKIDAKYLPLPFKPDGISYLTFSSRNSFSLSIRGKSWDGTLEYFASDGTWAVWDGSSFLSAEANGSEYVLYLRGTGNTVISDELGWILKGFDISCIGNIETLLDYATVESGGHPVMARNCYSSMFYGCTSLTRAPELPATTLADYCYDSMFEGCTSLTQAPALPATTLAERCYAYMFQGCTSLTQAPTLPATTLASSCYYMMFYGCTSLTQVPELPATTLANHCYYRMFYGCTSLKLSETKTEEYTQEYRIPLSGNGTDASAALAEMFISTGGTFTGTPAINTTYYLSSDNMIVRGNDIANLNGYVKSMIDNAGECIPVPATAEVGQTIVVKAVDANGKPTEWAAADMASGADGKSAYAYAVEGGYTGTEAEFAEKLASGALIVTITESNGTLSANKTFSEIVDAIYAGTTVLASYNYMILTLIGMTGYAMYFGVIHCDNDGTDAMAATVVIEIADNDGVNDISADVEIPKTLPNPNALTFTGAVNGSYDGSEALTVEIPSGGSHVPKPLTYDYMPEGYPTRSVQTTTLMEEQEVEFGLLGGRYLHGWKPSVFEIVVGQTYIVKWDGTEYECVGVVYDKNAVIIGNTSIVGGGDDTSEPFICTYVKNEDSNMFATLDTSATHTISVKTTAETVIPMAEEFIPKMNVSAFTNDAGYLTLDTLPKYGGESV